MRAILYIFVFLISVCGVSQKQALAVQSEQGSIPVVGATEISGFAFPTAIGYGRNANPNITSVYVVDNLNNSGAGSLRDAVSVGNRAVVFDIGGNIDLTSVIDITQPNIYIMGQTAPSPIIVRNHGIYVKESNIAIRHIIVMIGLDNSDPQDDCWRVYSWENGLHVHDVVLDHVEGWWSRDENFDVGGSTQAFTNNSVMNVTIQNSFSSEPLDFYHFLMGQSAVDITIARNFYGNGINRIAEAAYGNQTIIERWEWSNNFIYNYSRATNFSYGSHGDVLNNVYATGPTLPAAATIIYKQGINIGSPTTPFPNTIHQSGNIELGTVNPFGLVNSAFSTNDKGSRVLTNSVYNPIPASNVVATLTDDVGASVFTHSARTRVWNDYLNGTGDNNISDEDEVGGFPSNPTTNHNANNEHGTNGLPLWFRNAHGVSDPLAVKSNWTINSNTYSNPNNKKNIEVYSFLVAGDF